MPSSHTAPCSAFEVPHTTAGSDELLPARHGVCRAGTDPSDPSTELGTGPACRLPTWSGAGKAGMKPGRFASRRCRGRVGAGPGAADVGAGQNRRALIGRGLAYLIDSSRPAQPHSARGLRGVFFSPRPGEARPIE